MGITSWNENTGEPRVWKLTSAVRGRAGGKGLSHQHLACCLSYYDLGEPLPDHSSLTRIRERYGVEVFLRFFDAIVEQCQQAGLVWGKELYFDGTKVQANASTDSIKPRFAVEAHLAHLFTTETPEMAEEVEQGLTHEEPTPSEPTEQEERAAPRPLPISSSPEVYEELSQQNETRHEWIEQLGAQDRSVSSKWYQRVADLRVSTTDPDASLMLTKDGAHLGYHVHYVVDGGKSRIILQVLVTPSEVMDNQPMLDLLWRVRFRWKLRPRQITGDTKYGTAENIMAIEREGIRAYVPLPDFEHRAPYFSQRDFRYNPDQDVYLCPNNAVLRLHTCSPSEHAKRYQAEAATCNACPLKAQCTPGTSGRYISRNFAEEYFERVRSYQTTEAYKKALRKRSVWVEPLFAEGKEWHGMRRFRLRELWRVNCEGLMRAAGQNLKRLLKKRGWGRRPFPAEALHAPLFGCFWMMYSSFLEGVVGFLAHWLGSTQWPGRETTHLVMSFAGVFFNTLHHCATRMSFNSLLV